MNSVREMKNRLGIRDRREARPEWAKEDLERLKELHAKGMSARKVHRVGTFSFSLNAIQKQMCRLGLAKKNKVFKFPPEVREKFRNFLKEKWEGKVPDDLVEIWNRENAKHPTNRRKVISYLTKLGLKIPYGEVQRIKKLRTKVEEIARSGGPSGETLERIRMKRVEMMTKRIEKGRDIWTGLPMDMELCEEE